jgi:hypothetical protein
MVALPHVIEGSYKYADLVVMDNLQRVIGLTTPHSKKLECEKMSQTA